MEGQADPRALMSELAPYREQEYTICLQDKRVELVE